MVDFKVGEIEAELVKANEEAIKKFKVEKLPMLLKEQYDLGSVDFPTLEKVEDYICVE